METEVPRNADGTIDWTQVDDITALIDSLVAEFDALYDSGEADAAALTEVATAIREARTEQSARDEAEQADAAERERIHAEVHGTPDETPPEGDGETPPEGEATPDAETVETPADPERVPVAAGGAPARRPAPRGASAAGVRRQGVREQLPPATPEVVITAAADVPGFATNARMNLTDIAVGFHERAFGLENYSGRKHVARVRVPLPAEHVIPQNASTEQAEAIIAAACNQDRLDLSANSLVAAGGWCAPSTPLFDLFRIDSAAGLFDLPEVGVPRAGISVPDFLTFDGPLTALWTWTEANDQAATANGTVVNKALTTNVATITTGAVHNLAIGDIVIVSGVDATFDGTFTVVDVPTTVTFTYAKTAANVASVADTGYWVNTTPAPTKPCVRIACPGFTEYRLGAEGLCVTHGNLTDRAWPELSTAFVGMVMNLHMHRISNAKLAAVVATAAAVTIGAGDITSDAPGDILSAIELQAQDMRSQYLMDPQAVLEVVLPAWAPGFIRASMAKRAGQEVEAMSIPDEQIVGWFRDRRIRPQFPVGYQPLSVGGVKLTVWPTVIKFLIYPAGSYFTGNGGNIDLGVQRDSTLNATNDFTLAWSEQFYLVGQRGPDAREVTVTTSPNGVTACCA